MESFYFGNIYGNAILFWFLTLIGIALGVIFYTLCAYPHLRRAQWNQWKPTRTTSTVIGAIVTLTIVSIAWLTTWSEFYRLDIVQDEIRLQYFLPERERAVPLDQIKILSQGITLDRFDYCRLVIENQDGRKFRSANVNPRIFRERFMAIREFIR